MTEFSVEFELEEHREAEAEFELEPRSELEPTFELNVATEGPQGPEGPRGPQGEPGQNATINGYTTVVIEGTDGLSLRQEGSTLYISGKTLQDTKQDKLSTAQMNAVNSGITTQKVTSYDNHISNTTIHVTQQDKTTWNGKQNALNSTQLEAVNSGITSSGVSQITTNKNDISTETTNRQNADNGLQSQIDAIVASSDVTDIVGTYAQLQAYDTSSLPPNSIIKVLKDESQNDETTYYRWVITGGIGSWVLIGEEGPYYTKSQADARFATSAQGAKADTALQPSALNGYATQQWVGQQGYLTSSALNGYATEQWVQNRGYITQAVEDDSTTSTTLGWSASKLNGIIGDIESTLNAIRGV